MFPHTVETERLRLERLTTDDTRALYEHTRAGAPHIDEITRHVGWEPHATPKATHDFVTAMEEGWEKRENATYVVRTREGEPLAGEVGGTTGLGFEWDRRRGTLGLWLREPLWGRGYSGERAGALLELAFEHLSLEVVAVTHDPENEQSRRAIEKYVDRFGGRREGTERNALANPDGSVGDAVRYSVSCEEWCEATGGDEDDGTAVTFHWD
ncbi:GNAT family N-acetyltransferase [Halomarina litorea]|uniref:GNAT family N-acetyltransferase n=1 Tax=Halomarina litorea TaxID=2961595 RepID=UPI0020C3426B|nr:GNAT family N-acetyltransferase [Halomarina sp. BCD28]